ncbi:hypothetical protein GSbR_43230 [Geobacter sp. SVR]|nr:hypothetical protein GSVR_02010 [Geobacter sp. SVR]GCF87723.1 hypothetical protein GSbR_43230 [Geobacter sp. SVR]
MQTKHNYKQTASFADYGHMLLKERAKKCSGGSQENKYECKSRNESQGMQYRFLTNDMARAFILKVTKRKAGDVGNV